MIIGFDDTDMPGTPGTNQLVRQIADALPAGFTFDFLLRHQLLFDPRIPYTSKNGSASLGVLVDEGRSPEELLDFLRERVRAFAPEGSDPGLCVVAAPIARDLRSASGDTERLGVDVPEDVIAFGRRCQREPVRQEEALALARAHGIVLEPLGGTGDGVIGALAAVGLRAWGDDGRVVHRAGWRWPDDLSGEQPVAAVLAAGVDEIRSPAGIVTDGVVDVGKHLRPNFRGGRVVLFVEPEDPVGSGGASAEKGVPPPASWKALKLP
ncbi:MAG: ABC transporter substrate-binding protein [Gemmatimonadetes bacterium]|nr:ABC transporter substrate-binding protein [Gemmatimonadota bacterium]